MEENMRRPLICGVGQCEPAEIGHLRGPGRRITSLLFGPKHGEQLIRGSEVTSSQGRRNQRRHGLQLFCGIGSQVDLCALEGCVAEPKRDREFPGSVRDAV
jgi:hypothetical protein